MRRILLKSYQSTIRRLGLRRGERSASVGLAAVIVADSSDPSFSASFDLSHESSKIGAPLGDLSLPSGQPRVLFQARSACEFKSGRKCDG